MRIKRTRAFDRQLKSLIKKHYSKESYKEAIKALANDDQELLHKLKDHSLTGNLKGLRELHIEKDWLLIYERHADILTLVLVATGSHHQLLNK